MWNKIASFAYNIWLLHTFFWEYMKLSQYGYEFSEDMIAKYPTVNRDDARLMVLHRDTGEIEHRIFKDIIEYFDEKDMFVFTHRVKRKHKSRREDF